MKNFIFIFLFLITTQNCYASVNKIDMSKWQYNSYENVFYQLSIPYCENFDEKYEKLAIFIPAGYLKCTPNGNETYSCKANTKTKVKNYNIKSAPIVLPTNTSNNALKEYSSVWDYTNEGFIYIHAGFKKQEAPSDITDLKAAIRYIRYNKDVIPWNTNRIFIFGMEESVILGTTGDSELYEPYLNKIGAAKTSDTIVGAMAWNPVINIETENQAYEWYFGTSRTDLDKKTQEISNKMAEEYALYFNSMKFRKDSGALLELIQTNKGIYQGGSYYIYLEKLIDQSLTNFLYDNLFPIDMNTYGKEKLSQEFEDSEEKNTEDLIFNTPEEYVNFLNREKIWISYDSVNHSAKISNLKDFMKYMKPEIKPVGAFDNLKRKPDIVNMYNPMNFLMPTSSAYKTSKVAKHWRIRSGLEQTNTSLPTEINLVFALKEYCGKKNVDFEVVWGMGNVKAERRGTPDENFIKWVNKCVIKSKSRQ